LIGYFLAVPKYRSELSYLKKKAREGDLNFNTPVMRRIERVISS